MSRPYIACRFLMSVLSHFPRIDEVELQHIAYTPLAYILNWDITSQFARVGRLRLDWRDTNPRLLSHLHGISPVLQSQIHFWHD